MKTRPVLQGREIWMPILTNDSSTDEYSIE